MKKHRKTSYVEDMARQWSRLKRDKDPSKALMFLNEHLNEENDGFPWTDVSLATAALEARERGKRLLDLELLVVCLQFFYKAAPLIRQFEQNCSQQSDLYKEATMK